MNGLERIRLLPLQDKVVSVEKALQLIQDGDVVGLSGFGGQVKRKLCLWPWLNMHRSIQFILPWRQVQVWGTGLMENSMKHMS